MILSYIYLCLSSLIFPFVVVVVVVVVCFLSVVANKRHAETVRLRFVVLDGTV